MSPRSPGNSAIFPSKQPTLRPLWSFPLEGEPCGLSLAREAGLLLAWDRAGWLHLFGRSGQPQARRRLEGLTAACCADDGSACAAVGGAGEVWWLAPDLMSRWERKLPRPTIAAALDPFGQYLAVADDQGGLHLLDRLGQPVGRGGSPRPLYHLAFAPALPLLVGCADYGLVAAFDLAGQPRWRAGLVANVGALAVSGEPAEALLACFSEGLLRYGPDGQALGRLEVPGGCRLAAVNFAGQLVLATGLDSRLLLLDRSGRVLAGHDLDRPAAAIALGALGRDAFAALAGGPVVRLALDFPS